jgi:hypothetical protein
VGGRRRSTVGADVRRRRSAVGGALGHLGPPGPRLLHAPMLSDFERAARIEIEGS